MILDMIAATVAKRFENLAWKQMYLGKMLYWRKLSYNLLEQTSFESDELNPSHVIGKTDCVQNMVGFVLTLILVVTEQPWVEVELQYLIQTNVERCFVDNPLPRIKQNYNE